MTRPAAYAVLFAAVFCVSTSGPFFVMARMDAYTVVLLRMAVSSVLFLAWAWARGELAVPPGHLRRIATGALVLAAHWVLWIKAFDLTDYASNLLLLVMQPVMAAVIDAWLGARHGKAIWISVGLAIAGLTLITGGDFSLGPRALLGDAMCIVGAAAIAAFYAITREARAATPIAAFMGVSFAVGSLAVLPIVIISGARVVAYPTGSWAWLGLLVGVTTIAGHGLMNLAARHVRLFTLNLVIVLEPAIAIALGRVMFGAPIHPTAVAGGAFLVAAVIVGIGR